MKQSMLFFIVTVIILVSTTFSNSISEYNKAMNYLTTRNEVYFKFWIKNYSDIDIFYDDLMIENINGLEVTAYANKKQFDKFLSYSFEYKIETPPGMLLKPEMSDYNNIEGEFKIDKYPTYEGYLKLLSKFQEDFPEICQVKEIGTSVKKRKLMVVKLSDNVAQDEPEPKFFSTGNIHGDETEGYVLMLKSLKYICNNYGKDEKITAMLDNIQIYFLPLTNPDGLYAGGNNTVSGAKRANANGADLNRSFPCKCGKIPTAQPETKAVMKFAEENVTIASYIDFHGGVKVLLYPWSCTKTYVADRAWWEHVMGNYCDITNDAAGSNHMKYNIAYSLYNRPTHGTTKDYWTYHRPSRGCTMELWKPKTIAESSFEKFQKYNQQAFFEYIEQVQYGIRGVVTDSITNKPIAVKVGIVDHDKDNSFFVSEPKFGDYYRLIAKGTYNVIFTNPDYHSKTITGVTVENDKATVLDVKLVPLATNVNKNIVENSIKAHIMSNGNGVIIKNPNNVPISNLAIYDINGKIIQKISSKSILGNQHIIWNGINSRGIPVAKGFYLVNLQLKNKTISIKCLLTK